MASPCITTLIECCKEIWILWLLTRGEPAVAYLSPTVFISISGCLPKNNCLWAAITANLTPIESVSCEQHRARVFGQTFSLGFLPRTYTHHGNWIVCSAERKV
jgi:hypothetical protein